MTKRALVTLLIGDRYLRTHEQYFLNGWRQYAQRHGLDLVLLARPLDVSPRAASRSPAWQKCLILEQPEVRKYDQVAWVDSDVLIRPEAPNIFEGVNLNEFAAADAMATPTREDYVALMERLYAMWNASGLTHLRDDSPAAYYRHFGFEQEFTGVVQTGVLVLTPQLHAPILRNTYDSYEDKGPAYWHYEMRPLGYELLAKAEIRWLSPRFNLCWDLHKALHYSFLKNFEVTKKTFWTRGAQEISKRLVRECLDCTYQNNYFLHFAGGSQDYQCLGPVAAT